MKITEDNTEFAIGTPGYMCPEQARGEEMDHRGDLYSIGVMLYEMLTGKLPFSGRATMDVMLAHATEAPPSFGEAGVADIIAPAVEAVVLDCLAKLPADRPQTAREMSERFETALAHEQAMLETLTPPGYPGGAATGTSPAATCILKPSLKNNDPHAVVHYVEAWMPEAIATYKLRGFVAEVGGEVVESVPGLIRVRLGLRGGPYTPAKGSWFGLGRKNAGIDMELRLERADAERDALLHITLVLRPIGTGAASPEFRERCNQIYCDLRAYVMGR
jgi:serine/threonine-protein kinase